jgi:hypothetical protein
MCKAVCYCEGRVVNQLSVEPPPMLMFVGCIPKRTQNPEGRTLTRPAEDASSIATLRYYPRWSLSSGTSQIKGSFRNLWGKKVRVLFFPDSLTIRQ